MFDDQIISFIGAGTMGEAMIRGLLELDIVEPEQIFASDPWEERLDFLADRYKIHVTQDNRITAEKGNVVILSIKPQSIPYVLPEIRGHLRRQDLLLSIIAGAPIQKLSDGAAHASVIRAMPNTPAQIGMGITVWTATNQVSDKHREQGRMILGSLGDEIYLDDESYRKMREYGADLCVSKPLPLDRLREEIAGLLYPEEARQSAGDHR